MTKALTDLTDLQLLILGVLWDTGGATATAVHAQLEATTGLTRKTIGTLLHRLDRQGIVEATPEGREFRYRSTATRQQVQEARLAGLVGGLFEGDVSALVTFALRREDIPRETQARIRQMLTEHKARRASDE